MSNNIPLHHRKQARENGRNGSKENILSTLIDIFCGLILINSHSFMIMKHIEHKMMGKKVEKWEHYELL
jgi:hypothetical protein